jgi:hypothetical protein
MVRARIASLALTGGLLLASGCLSVGEHPWFSRLHSSGCECCDTCNQFPGGAIAGFDGPILTPDPIYNVPPPPPPPTMGAPVQPPPGTTAPPPRIIPVPQANPYPYSPTGLRKLFGGSQAQTLP